MKSIKLKQLVIGLTLLTTFAAVMVLVFMPLIDGINALDYLDNLYNTISKGSAYYIPKVETQVADHGPKDVSLSLAFSDAKVATLAAQLLEKAGARPELEGETLAVSGDIEKILSECLVDAESGYHNNNDDLELKYGVGARQVLHAWWKTLSAMEKDLNKQKLFDSALLTHAVKAKAVECAYNYYGIEAQPIKERWGTVLFSLLFYVVYTIWYGYGIMFLFEGLGLELAAH